uniref:Uncharacterized protein n=1 Tax=Micrurus lemniscatus lemniscatus TaxID=129467 RepID=A0A2D4H729_MICLE
MVWEGSKIMNFCKGISPYALLIGSQRHLHNQLFLHIQENWCFPKMFSVFVWMKCASLPTHIKPSTWHSVVKALSNCACPKIEAFKVYKCSHSKFYLYCSIQTFFWLPCLEMKYLVP